MTTSWHTFTVPCKDAEDPSSPTRLFQSTRSIRMDQSPTRVVTLIPPLTTVSADFVPKHGETALHESPIHDWTWKAGWLRYSSHHVDPEETVVIAVQFPEVQS